MNARVLYIHELLKLSSKEQMVEIERMLLDIMDIVEQSDAEKPVIAAYNAFVNAK